MKIDRYTQHGRSLLIGFNKLMLHRPNYLSCGHILTDRTYGSNSFDMQAPRTMNRYGSLLRTNLTLLRLLACCAAMGWWIKTEIFSSSLDLEGIVCTTVC